MEGLPRLLDDLSPVLDKQMSQAERESLDLKHYYIGVEHLFLGMLKDHGLTEAVVKTAGLDPHTVLQALYQSLRPLRSKHLWQGVVLTPRCKQVLAAARDAARAQGFREMATRAPGDLSARLREELDRHRYLEEAA